MTDKPGIVKARILNCVGPATHNGNEYTHKGHEEPKVFQVPGLYLCHNFNLLPTYS